jgi:hypothetical protein
MSPPDTNAISRWSGEMAGSDIAARAATGARPPAGMYGNAAMATSAEARDAKENVTDDSEKGVGVGA